MRQAFRTSDSRALDAIERDAHAWMRRVAAGQMTHADGAALKRWCLADPAHARAFAEARRRWTQLGEAAELASARLPAERSAHARAAVPSPGRRWFVGGALGAAAAGAAVAAVHPPLQLWPSAAEWSADYRTGAGERRRVALDDAVSVELNTRTSVALRAPEPGLAGGIELIAGEAAIDLGRVSRGFAVVAGAGRSIAQNGSFEVRMVAGGVCVRCLSGQVRVEHAAGQTVLQAQQQLTYDASGAGREQSFDPAVASAWREGFVRFVDTPLGEVIDELNRYRSGRIVLLDSALAQRPVTGRFRIDALDVAVAQIRESLGLQARSLPGGVLLLA
ncbi:FecR family protein [Bordetella genomosp. 13]|uniref:Iron dicitrate transport regulator FecR n=1 Tax=Bordetella genomosp. 13 TaxID=463040 RepID=A0A1W6ZDB4_9BORD|nr:FecR domain-containing protein [Bordetella genomosp. 13]ARP95265.1 hypothetical protein CAL15_13250 [Bordetella genomosp. 13]